MDVTALVVPATLHAVSIGSAFALRTALERRAVAMDVGACAVFHVARNKFAVLGRASAFQIARERIVATMDAEEVAVLALVKINVRLGIACANPFVRATAATTDAAVLVEHAIRVLKKFAR